MQSRLPDLKTALGALLLMTIVAACQPTVSAQPTVQLAMVIDGSGSISSGDWTVIVNGVADGVLNHVPQDGTVELTVVQFAADLPGETHGAFTFLVRTEVAPTVITSANVVAVSNTIRALVQGLGETPLADGVWVGWLNMAGSPNFNPLQRQVINLATDIDDRSTIVRWADTTLRNPAHTALEDVTDARNAAVAAGLDELDSEAIGPSPMLNYLRDSVAWPQPGTIAPPFTPGWVQWVQNAQAFADAVGEKFERILPHPTHPVGGTVMSGSQLPITYLLACMLLAATVAGLASALMIKRTSS
jgi:hypothetical protein